MQFFPQVRLSAAVLLIFSALLEDQSLSDASSVAAEEHHFVTTVLPPDSQEDSKRWKIPKQYSVLVRTHVHNVIRELNVSDDLQDNDEPSLQNISVYVVDDNSPEKATESEPFDDVLNEQTSSPSDLQQRLQRRLKGDTKRKLNMRTILRNRLQRQKVENNPKPQLVIASTTDYSGLLGTEDYQKIESESLAITDVPLVSPSDVLPTPTPVTLPMKKLDLNEYKEDYESPNNIAISGKTLSLSKTSPKGKSVSDWEPLDSGDHFYSSFENAHPSTTAVTFPEITAKPYNEENNHYFSSNKNIVRRKVNFGREDGNSDREDKFHYDVQKYANLELKRNSFDEVTQKPYTEPFKNELFAQETLTQKPFNEISRSKPLVQENVTEKPFTITSSSKLVQPQKATQQPYRPSSGSKHTLQKPSFLTPIAITSSLRSDYEAKEHKEIPKERRKYISKGLTLTSLPVKLFREKEKSLQSTELNRETNRGKELSEGKQLLLSPSLVPPPKRFYSGVRQGRHHVLHPRMRPVFRRFKPQLRFPPPSPLHFIPAAPLTTARTPVTVRVPLQTRPLPIPAPSVIPHDHHSDYHQPQHVSILSVGKL